MTRSPWKELSIDKNQKTMATKKSDSRTRTAVGMDISWRIEDLAAEYPTANSKSGETLQEAFKKFRNHRQRAIRLSKETNENILKSRADPVLMERLRIKFLERCKHYFGVPYAKKYQDPDTPEFNSPIFLDCCGLIRRVLRDLKEDFGFEVGPWNQAYMFDTLPKDIEGTENVKPGDLVFVSGIYYNKKSKRQRHNMVHVEVWAGDGEKTIGARWQKGKVQYHDSYKFTAKSYHSMQYHFKSIDTWLMGICKSHCKEHAWKRSTYKPGKKSIFSVDQTDELEDQEADPREESDSQTHGNSVKKDSKNSALEATNSDSMQYLRRKDQNLTNKTDLGFVKNFMIERNQLPRATNQTVLRESNSAKPSNSGLRISNLNHQNSELATFYDLEDCVQWLVSHVTNEAENELTIMGDNLVELNRCDSRIMSTDSASMESGEGVITVDGLDKTSVSSCTELRRIQNCSCPQCFQIEMHCIHEKTSNSKNEDKSESEFETLEENRELATSLECFDFVFDCGNQYEQISSDCIIQCPNHSSTNGSRRSTRSVSPSKVTRNGKGGGSSGSSGDRGSDNEGNNKKDMPFKNTRDGAKSVNRLSTKQPSFFIGGGNGNWMIEATLVSLGWRKIEDKRDESFNLKWVECKSQINYESFREGVQIANHISNINLLTTKLGLLCSLQEYERVTEKVGRAVGSKMRIPLSEFVPETHRLMGTSEKLKFVNEVYKDGEIWICKPTGMNQGKGIYLVSSREQLVEKMNLDGTDDGGVRRSRVRPPQGRIIQRYVMNPLLLNGYKFDIRAYMLIASTTPYIVLYHSGYVRLSCVPYTPYTQDDRGLHAHLTNQFVQKKHPMYSSMKEDTVWSFDRLQSYIDQKYAKDKELPENWVFTTFTKRMHQIMCTCFQSVRQKLHRRTGTFDLLGFDFLIDDDFKVWLLEVNVNPALHTNCQVLMDLLPGVVDETLKLVIEICDKTKKKRSLLPLENLKGFQVLYCEGGK